MNDEITITCTSIDCPERTGGKCTATADPNLMVDLFLEESNKIENVRDEKSHKQARRAWDYLASQDKLDGGVILKVHKLLMLNQPILGYQRGYWRREQVGVYKNGILLREAPQWRLVPELVAQWLQAVSACVAFSHSKQYHEVEVNRNEILDARIRNDHIGYEKIHPFIDGNGRTGRMFMNWTRLKVGLPLLVIFEDDKQEYYKWFI